MAKRRRKRANPKRRRRAAARRNPSPVRRRRRRSNPRRHFSRRRRNPSGGMGSAIAAVLVGGVAAAAIYGGLAFQTTVTGNTSAAIGAGIGVAGGIAVGMMGSPEIGAAIAAAGVGVALAQFATAEVASYEANQTTAPAATTSGLSDTLYGQLGSVNSINGPSDTLPLHSRGSLAQAKMNLRGRGLR